jgi:hypothetical protein
MSTYPGGAGREDGVVEFLFHWKNLDATLLGIHLGLLQLRIAYAALRRDRARVVRFLRAVPRLLWALRRRAAVRGTFRESDRDVLEAIG